MTRKSKFFLFSLIFLFLFALLVLGMISVGKRHSPFTQFIKSLLPENVNRVLKKTVFSIPLLNQKTEQLEISIKELEATIVELNAKMEYLMAGSGLQKSKDIKSKSNNYNIKTFLLPFPSFDKWSTKYELGGKPIAYLEQTDNEIIIASGHGDFFSFEKKNIESENLVLKRIESNIKNLIKDEKFYSLGAYSIRDLLVLNNKILFSFTKELSNNCYNTSIMISDFNLNYLKFTEFFSYKDCLSKKTNKGFSPVSSGGRMVSFKNGKILLTIGSFSRYGPDAIIISEGHRKQTVKYEAVAQAKNSMFGKIISIDLKSKDYEILTMGSRNQQGLYYDEDKNIIIFTEHGPKGGDEININFHPDNKIIENYGWPISSYGEHYDGVFRENAPLHKSHKDFGFIEPIKYFTPSIAISEIISIPETFNEKFTNDFFVGAMGFKKQINEGDQSIHHIRFNENFDKIIFEDVIPIGERIRDMIFIKEKNIVLMVLESTPTIGILKQIFN